MQPRIAVRKALNDPQLLGKVLDGKSWDKWRVLLIASMGEKLTAPERKIFNQLTGRSREPLKRVDEFVAVVGRRGGKSRALSVLATYIAALCEHPRLVRGERGVCLLVAPDQKQASIIFNYISANFDDSAILRQMVVRKTAETIELDNGICIDVRAASFRRLRGPTYVAVIADECAFFMSDEYSANADVEIINAIRPGLATTSGPVPTANQIRTY
jgi:phage terminase large subunit-like protein